MDGVERVMVLGILAVIVAILSFAWGATGDGTDVLDGVTDGGTSSAVFPLSSASAAGPAGVVVKPARDPIEDRRAAREDFVREHLPGSLPGSAGELPIPFRPADMDSGEPRISPLALHDAPSGREDPATGAKRGTTPAGRQPARQQAQPPEVEPLVPEGEVIAAAAPVPPRLAAAAPDAAQAPAQSPAEAQASDAGSGTRLYTVQKGDTLWQIAYREVDQAGDTGRIVEAIHELNPTIDPSQLVIGQTIKLPSKPPQGAERLDLERRAVESGARVYTIAAGDTLRSIAQARLGDAGRWQEIYRLNPNTIREPGQIRVGLRILLPAQ